MSLEKRIGDHAIKLCDEFRKTDPRLDNPIKRGLVSLFEWTFPDAVIRSVASAKEKSRPAENNNPDGPN